MRASLQYRSFIFSYCRLLLSKHKSVHFISQIFIQTLFDHFILQAVPADWVFIPVLCNYFISQVTLHAMYFFHSSKLFIRNRVKHFTWAVIVTITEKKQLVVQYVSLLILPMSYSSKDLNNPNNLKKLFKLNNWKILYFYNIFIFRKIHVYVQALIFVLHCPTHISGTDFLHWHIKYLWYYKIYFIEHLNFQDKIAVCSISRERRLFIFLAFHYTPLPKGLVFTS